MNVSKGAPSDTLFGVLIQGLTRHVKFDYQSTDCFKMKKVLTFSLIVLLASSGLVGCKSGTSCFTRTGSRVPIIGSSSGDYTDVAYGSNGARVINANPTNEVMMMNAASAYSQCVPCAPAQCAPCAPAQASCNPCDPCSTARGGVAASGYPTSAASYSGI